MPIRLTDLNLKAARKAAKDKLAEVQLGGDPQAAKKATQRKAVREERTTIKAVTLKCVEKLTLRPSTRKEWGRLAAAEIVPAFASLPADLSRADIRGWAESIRDGKRRWKDRTGQRAAVPSKVAGKRCRTDQTPTTPKGNAKGFDGSGGVAVVVGETSTPTPHRADANGRRRTLRQSLYKCCVQSSLCTAARKRGWGTVSRGVARETYSASATRTHNGGVPT